MTYQGNTDKPKAGRPRETSLPYVAIDPHIESHPRTLALVDALADHCDTPETMLVIIPLRLFLHAGRSAVDGRLGRLSPRALRRIVAPDIAIDAQALFDAMTHRDTGFLVVDEDGVLWVHDWKDAGGRAATKREEWRDRKASKAQLVAQRQEKYREKKRRQRARKSSRDACVMSPGTGGGQAGDTMGTGGGQAKMSPPEKFELPSQNKDLEYSCGIPPEVSRILPVKGKAKGKLKTAAQAAVAFDLETAPSDQVLTTPQVEASLVGAGLMCPGEGLGHVDWARLRDAMPVTAGEMRHGIAKSLGAGVNSPRRYVGGTIVSSRKDSSAPCSATQATEPRLGYRQEPKSAPERIEDADRRRCEAWRRELQALGYPIDESWVRDMADREVNDADLDILRQCDGDWSRYHDMVRRGREVGLAGLASLGLACGVH